MQHAARSKFAFLRNHHRLPKEESAVGDQQRQRDFGSEKAVAVRPPFNPDPVQRKLGQQETGRQKRTENRSRQRGRQPDVDQRHPDSSDRHQNQQKAAGGRKRHHIAGSSLTIGIPSMMESSTLSTLCHSPWKRSRSRILCASTTLTIARTSCGVT